MTKQTKLDDKADAILAEAADWYFTVCELGEDEDLDPDDHLEVIRRAFASSDCFDFSWMLNRMTGWQVVTIAYRHPKWPPGEVGHHSMVRAPDGRLLDVKGWTADEATACVKACPLKGAKFVVQDDQPMEPTCIGDIDETDGSNVDLKRIADVIRCLPWAPFDTPEFREMSMRPLAGVDPVPSDTAAPARRTR